MPASSAPTVYLLPSILGGGSGDLEEIRIAAWRLRALGLPVRWFGPPGAPRPVPPRELSDWPVRRIDRTLGTVGDRALTLSSQFGVTAERERPGPLGAPGPWAGTVRRLERSYGPDRVLHLSLEEFARNLSADQQERERWREGGRSHREIAARRRAPDWPRAVAEMRRLFRRFRSLDRANLLALFPAFAYSRGFQRDFPGAIQCGPLSPLGPRRRLPRSGARSRTRARWLWYASPASSPMLLSGILEGAEGSGRGLDLRLRTAHPFPLGNRTDPASVTVLPRSSRRAWEREFRRASLRIVTGSRTLLEAIELGGPFLYFNGATGTGSLRRAHRPEKLRQLLQVWRAEGMPSADGAELERFARASQVPAIVARRLSEPSNAHDLPRGIPSRGFRPPFGSAERCLSAIAGEWARSEHPSTEFAARWRASAAISGPLARISRGGR